MPFPDSEYPSILRGRDKRESQRLLAAAPAMLAALQAGLHQMEHGTGKHCLCKLFRTVIAKAEGRE